MFLEVILAVVATGLVTWFSGYHIARRFWATDYAYADRNGDFGGPRGGTYSLLSGCFCGMLFDTIMTYSGLFSATAAGASFLTAFVVGVIAGITGGLSARYLRNKKDGKDTGNAA